MITLDSVKISYQSTEPKFVENDNGENSSRLDYTDEFKKKVINAINNGMTNSTAAERFIIPLVSVNEFMKIYRAES